MWITLLQGISHIKIVNNRATITNCSRVFAGVITIPETIQAYPVTAIASSAFSGCSAVTGVNYSHEGVKTIGGSAFASCDQVEID